jgi:hypothetical protein
MSYYDGSYVGRQAQQSPWNAHAQGQRQGYDYNYQGNYQGNYQHQQAQYGTSTYKLPLLFIDSRCPSNHSKRNIKPFRLLYVLLESPAHPSESRLVPHAVFTNLGLTPHAFASSGVVTSVLHAVALRDNKILHLRYTFL